MIGMWRLAAGAVLLATSAMAAETDLTAPELDTRLDRIWTMIRDERAFAVADSVALELLADVETSFGHESVSVARVLDPLVIARLGQRAVDAECLSLAERAVRIKERDPVPEEPELATSLLGLGRVLQVLERSGEARTPLERALEIRRSRFGAASAEVADVLTQLAQVYIDLDLEPEAASMLQETLAIYDASPDTDVRTVSPLLYNLAWLRRALGQFRAAEELYQRLLDITPESVMLVRASVFNGLGALHHEEGRYAESLAELEHALAVAREAGAHPVLMTHILNNLGFVLSNLGDHAEAVTRYDEALSLQRELHGDEHTMTATMLANLAETHLALGHVDEARELHEQALGIRERILGPDHAETATSLGGLAEVYLEMDRPDDARRLLERALAIRTRHLGPDHFDTGKAVARLARSLAASDSLDAAERSYRRALDVIAATLDRGNPEWSEVSLGLAEVELSRGAFTEAWTLAREAETRSREHARLTAAALSERQALQYASIRKEALDLILTLVVSGHRSDALEAWDHVIRSRALVLNEVVLRRERLHAEADTSVTRLMARYADASTALATLMVRGPDASDPGSFRDRLREARADREQAERALALRSSAFRDRLATARRGANQVLAARPEGSAVLAYVRYERSGPGPGAAYAAFVTGKGAAAPVVVDLGSAESIDALVADWRAEVVLPSPADLDRATRRYRDVGRRLREAIWDPVVPALEDARTVFVVPDGELHRVSAYTLPDEGGYLVESGIRVHYLAAERDLVEPPTEAEGRGMLALGGPDFDATDDTVTPVTEAGPASRNGAVRFSPLPGTRAEVKAVAGFWTGGDAVVLTGPDASEAAFKARAPGCRVVHVATHGFFREATLRSGRARTRSIGGLSARPPVAPHERMPVLSGLALAGANHGMDRSSSGEDGILTAEEVAALDFSGTEWVVLSACDTGLGDIESGEGVVGLRRAFEVSGVGTVIMSLWDVDDEATRRWMQQLYLGRFERKETTVDSMWEASREVLEWCRESLGTDHPFFWGAFVAAGDWR